MPTSKTNIIQYYPRDKAKTASFIRQIFKEMNWPEWRIDYIDDPGKFFGLTDNGFWLLVKRNDQIIGCGGVKYYMSGIGIIKRFYIKKEYRGTGLAIELLNQLKSKAREEGLKRLQLDV